MSAQRCPACGYRRSLSGSTCVNCGRALLVTAGAQPEQSGQLEFAEETLSEPMRKTPRSSAVPVRLEQTGSEQPWRRISMEQQAFLTPTPVVSEHELSPYQPTLDDLSPYPTPLPFQFTSSQAVSVTPDREEREPLPRGFALTRPDLYGTVLHIEVREQINDLPNIAGALLTIVTEVFWSFFNVPSSPRDTQDRIEVSRLRVQSPDGRAHDVLIRGVQRGANLALGDIVSLWGKKKRGSLLVSKGYDHTTRARISGSGSGLFWPALLFLLIVGVGYMFVRHISIGDFWHWLAGVPQWFKQLVGSFSRK